MHSFDIPGIFKFTMYFPYRVCHLGMSCHIEGSRSIKKLRECDMLDGGVNMPFLVFSQVLNGLLELFHIER